VITPQNQIKTEIVTNVTLVKSRLVIWPLAPNQDGIYKLI
jgi:hypothetical protein